MNRFIAYKFESGRVRKRAARKCWELVCTKTGSDGSVRTVTRLTEIPCSPDNGSGKRRASQELEDWIASMRQEEAERAAEYERAIAFEGLDLVRRTNLEMTVAEYGRLFNERRLMRGEIEPSTASDWMNDFRRYCLAGLPEGIRVFEVTRADVTNMIDYVLHARGLASATARRGFLALNQLMKEAAAYDGLPRNPCAGIKPPKKGNPRQNPLSVRKAKVLVSTLLGMRQTRVVFSALCALLFGISEGEVCALRLRDLDLEDTQSILIRRAIGHDGNVEYEKDPKTRSRKRRIFLTDLMRDLFRRRIAVLAEECQQLGMPLSDDLYLVGRPDGSFWSTKCLSKGWGQMSDMLGLKGLEGKRVSFHDLRHTFATCANAAGLDINIIARIMGHSTTQVTMMVYISVDPDEAITALRRLEAKYDLDQGLVPQSEGTNDTYERRALALSIFGYSDAA